MNRRWKGGRKKSYIKKAKGYEKRSEEVK